MVQTPTEEKNHLHKKIKDLQTALKLCQNEVGHLKDLLEEKTEEANKAVDSRQMKTTAYINVLHELTAAQKTLEDTMNRREALETNLQMQLKENQQVHQRKLEENEERFRRELSDETEKIRKEFSDREEAFKKDLSEKDQAILKTLQDVSEHWEARADEQAKKMRQLEEFILKRQKTEVEELQVCFFIQPV